MDLLGELVTHKVFGSGRITKFSTKYITVLFDANEAEKEFAYPSAFGPFLEIENESLQSQIDLDKNLLAQRQNQPVRIANELKKPSKPIEVKKTKSNVKKY